MAKRKQQLERKRQRVFWYYSEDGIWDINFGLAVIWFGIIVLMRWPAWLAIFALLLGGLIYLLKQKFAVPRLAKLKVPQKKRRAVFEMAGIMLVVLIGTAWLLKEEPGLPGFFAYFRQNPLVMASIYGGAATFYLAYVLAYNRLYIHGFVLFLGFFLDAWLFPEKPIGIAIGAGFIILVSGLNTFFQFIRQHPTNH